MEVKNEAKGVPSSVMEEVVSAPVLSRIVLTFVKRVELRNPADPNPTRLLVSCEVDIYPVVPRPSTVDIKNVLLAATVE